MAFIPVGINYDRVVEDRTLLRSLDPEAPKRGKAYALGTATRFLLNQFGLALRGRWISGYACVNFGSPISLRHYLAAHGVDLKTLSPEARIEHVKGLAEDLMGAVSRLVPVLPVPLVAAVFLDGGLDHATAFVERHFRGLIEHAASEPGGRDWKSLLGQWAQTGSEQTPRYVVLSTAGADHSKTFEVCVALGRRRFRPAFGRSKKEAEQRAARAALRELAV